MKSYLSLIPIAARVRRKQSKMIILCIVLSVFLVTTIFSLVDSVRKMETAKEGTGISELMELGRTRQRRLRCVRKLPFLHGMMCSILIII